MRAGSEPSPTRRFRAGTPPRALYVHIPWCVRKCPYCDFNSHALGSAGTGVATGVLPEDAYVGALLTDLERELARESDRALDVARAPTGGTRPPLVSIFIGGGTPSLLTGAAIARLLSGIAAHGLIGPHTEITMEANPGTVDAGHFADYLAAGVNRLSIGVQSLSAVQLQRLGRIHDPAQARAAVAIARRAGCTNLNLDVMFGLPGQTLTEAAGDLAAALALAPEHLSYYQLTLEPNTAFYAAPPPALPDPDRLADIEEQGQAMLAAAGFRRYEISAWAQAGRRCRHNLNYWTFGDYLGIGAGAHGKRSDPATGEVRRRAKQRAPQAYLDALAQGRDLSSSTRSLDDAELILEFALNACRLVDGFTLAQFERHTGLDRDRIAAIVHQGRADGLIDPTDPVSPTGPARPGATDRVRPSALGLRFANDLIARFDGTASADHGAADR